MYNLPKVNNKLKVVAGLLCSVAASHIIAHTTDDAIANTIDTTKAEATEVWKPQVKVIQTPLHAAPSDAIVLFDGKNLSRWQSAEGGAAKWKIQHGALVVVPKTGNIKTKKSFCDVQLHIEWMTPTKITNSDGTILEGQARNNSGIFFQEQYEVQILDSYQNKTYANGQAGAIYKQAIPLVNASRAAGQWQTYDIIFTAPTFDNTQTLINKANITALHNGVLVQNHAEIQGATTHIGKPTYTAHACAPLLLQDHGNPIRFRNIWIRTL
jgi:hypothetical protein